MSDVSTAIEPSQLRAALGHYASGITIITSQADGEPIGFTCQSFHSLSVNPPLVSFSVMCSSYSYPKIRQTGRFAVNILSSEQIGLSSLFARQGADKWLQVDFEPSPLGNPILVDCLLWLDCEIHAEHQVGDHLLVIGEVKALQQQQTAVEQQPLVYFKGQYRHLADG